jgi:putative oxidoreductase
MQAFNKLHNDDLGKLVLRLTVGGLMMFHGIAKLSDGFETVRKIGGGLAGKGLPEFIAYGVLIGEVIVPILLIVGYFTRPAAIILILNMIVAIWLAHPQDFFKLSAQGGAWALELQGFYLFGALAILFLGAGKYSVSRGAGTWD